METKHGKLQFTGAGADIGRRSLASFHLCFSRHQLSPLPAMGAQLAAVVRAVGVADGDRQTLVRIMQWGLARTETSFPQNLVLKHN